jgi:hypothetical protein
MQTTQSAHSWLWPGLAATDPQATEPQAIAPEQAAPLLGAPAREHDARIEIARLRNEIEQLVRTRGDDPRDTLDSALESVTRLQIVTANIDACSPPSETYYGVALVALADSHLRGHSDAIERGMTYTADNQLELLKGEK